MGEGLNTHASLQQHGVHVLQDDTSDDDIDSSFDAESGSPDDISYFCSSDLSKSEGDLKETNSGRVPVVAPIWAQY